jgi:hypothetical protein
MFNVESGRPVADDHAVHQQSVPGVGKEVQRAVAGVGFEGEPVAEQRVPVAARTGWFRPDVLWGSHGRLFTAIARAMQRVCDLTRSKVLL